VRIDRFVYVWWSVFCGFAAVFAAPHMSGGLPSTPSVLISVFVEFPLALSSFFDTLVTAYRFILP